MVFGRIEHFFGTIPLWEKKGQRLGVRLERFSKMFLKNDPFRGNIHIFMRPPCIHHAYTLLTFYRASFSITALFDLLLLPAQSPSLSW